MAESHPWVDDITGTGDSEDTDDSSTSSLFEDNFERAVEDENIENITVKSLRENIEKVDDIDLLKQALTLDTRTTAHNVYSDRAEELAEDTDDDNESESTDESGEGDVAADASDDEDETETEPEADDEPDDESADSDAVTESLQEIAEDIQSTADESADSDPQSDSSSEQVVEDTPDPEPATDGSGASDGGLLSQGMLAEAGVTNGILREDAVDTDERWTFLVWGTPGTGKSHIAHTAPAPICYIDTEGKADNLSSKFEKEIVYFDAPDFDSAKDALDDSLNLLAEVKEQHGVTGTIVVDSMTKMWEYAKQKHVSRAYPGADGPADVEFKSGLQGGDDYKFIKRYHNTNFRDVLADCEFHVVLTAMAKEDYNAIMEGADGKPMTDDGERNNEYAVENKVRLRRDDSGATVADMEKTDRTRLNFRGLEWPEFGDMVDTINRITSAEQSDDPVDVEDWDVDVVKGQPPKTSDSDGDDE